MSDMDFLEKLLDGVAVEWRALGEIGTWYGGGTPSKSNSEFWENGTIPWVSPKDMGRPIVDSSEDYITEAAIKSSSTKLVPAKSVAIVVRSSILDKLLPCAFIPVPVTLNQDMRAVIPHKNISAEYVAHMIRSRGGDILRVARKIGGSVASIDSGKLFSFRIPIPCPENSKKSLEIQAEIVRILDAFTELTAKLTAELTAELTARKKQYNYYRDQLLNFRGGDVEWKVLGEVGEFIRGKRFTKADYVEDGISVIHYGEIYTRYGVSTTCAYSQVRKEMAGSLRYAEPGDVVMAGVGETVEDVGKAVAWLGDYRVAIHDDSYAFRHSMNPKYIAYVMQTASFNSQKTKHVSSGKVKRLLIDSMKKDVLIPVPYPGDPDKSLTEQARIVSVLDKFDALTHSISEGLRREIELRQKQCAYYRDLLLSFPKPEEVAA
ncbi:restriction endonuclease subunit S [Metapseudomonas otitidis]|uniref:restriction endonuclease subunit S n=1 Tax=Metapseudomonas otitidis TaxID=319939 RepID=UPI003CF7BB25